MAYNECSLVVKWLVGTSDDGYGVGRVGLKVESSDEKIIDFEYVQKIISVTSTMVRMRMREIV